MGVVVVDRDLAEDTVRELRLSKCGRRRVSQICDRPFEEIDPVIELAEAEVVLIADEPADGAGAMVVVDP